METIGVADLGKYWITFEQLLRRWNIKEDLLASYCVCVDTGRGCPPISPHFYQGEFLVPGGETWTRLAKYEPEYKNAVEYLNKEKNESQLVRDFLEFISNIEKSTIWFPIADVEALENSDYSLASSSKTGVTPSTSNNVGCLDYISLEAPITFKDIFILWVGRDKYAEIKSYSPYDHYPPGEGPSFDEYLSLIRSVENQLDFALRNGHVHLFMQRIAAGREFYYEVPYNQGELFARTREGYGDELSKCFQFMIHHPDLAGVESEFLYFDSKEIFQKFPFLVPQSASAEVIQASRSAGEKGGTDQHISAWDKILRELKGGELTAARLAIEKWRGKTHEEAYAVAIPDGGAKNPTEFVSKKKKAAQLVAERYNLTMPDWNSKKQ